MGTDRHRRATAEIERASTEARSVVELCRAVRRVIDDVVPSDRWCAFSVDPATLLATNGYHDEGVDLALMPRLLELEHGAVDRNQLPALARSRTGVATLSDATGGDLAASARFRDVLEPCGVGDELRAVFRDGGAVWGALVLMRGDDMSRFTPADTETVRRLAPPIAAAFRRVLVRQHLDHADDARDAGILVLGGEPLEIRTASNAGRAWLDALDDGGTGALPTAVLSAAAAARRRPAASVTVRARVRSGRWMTITAETTSGRDLPADVGVILQPSRPAEIARIVGVAHGLTPRESDVVLLVAAGRTNQEMARLLDVSPYTVADHLKRIFVKLGVATRGELTSKLFFDHYAVAIRRDAPVGADGWFLDG